MSKPVRRSISLGIGMSVSAVLAAVGVVALRHALETPQPLKSQLPGEALLYRWRRHSIFYKVLGPVDAPPLVLLHAPEIGASAHEMQQITAPLALTYRVYALDLLGFGLSDRPGVEYSAALYGSLCQDFLLDVVQRPATLVANGLSCNYAVSVASSTPDLCMSLVLISPVALQGNQRSFTLGKFAEMPLVKTLLYPLLSTRLGFLATRGYRQRSQPAFTQFYKNTHQLGAEHAVMALLAGKLAESMAHQFETLRQPVLMIWGTRALEDQRISASLSDAATFSGPARHNRRVELIQEAGLAVHEEQPVSVVAAIRSWQAETTVALPEQAETRIDTLEAVIPSVTETETAPAAVSGATLEQGEEQRVEPLAASASISGSILAYCVKCKQKRAMLNPREVVLKNGRPAARGICPVCGTSLYRIGGLH